MARMKILVEAGVEITSARAMYDYGQALSFSNMAKGGFHVSGAGNHLKAELQREFVAACQEKARIMFRAYGAAEDRMLKYCCAEVLDGLLAYAGMFYFPDQYDFMATHSQPRTRIFMEEYEFDQHHTASVRTIRIDCLALGTYSFVICGSVHDTKFWSNKKATILEDLDVLATPGLFCGAYFWGLAEAHSFRSRAGMSAESLRLMKAFGNTFDQVDSTVDVLFSVLKYWSYTTDEFCYTQPEFLTENMKRRHWLVAPAEIELEVFKSWLSPPSASTKGPIEITGTSTPLLCDGDTAEVFEALGDYASGVAIANVSIQNFPYNPFLTTQSYAAIGRCNAQLNKGEEAKEAFEKAIAEAHRCGIKLPELLYLQDYITSNLAPASKSLSAQNLAGSLHGLEL